VSARRDAALVWVEHIALGLELLDPSAEVEVPGGRVYEVDERTGPTQPPPDARPMPARGPRRSCSMGRWSAPAGPSWPARAAAC